MPAPDESEITTCDPKDPEDLVISVDLVDIFHQAASAFSLNLVIDTPIAILAWGGEGGIGTEGIAGGGRRWWKWFRIYSYFIVRLRG